MKSYLHLPKLLNHRYERVNKVPLLGYNMIIEIHDSPYLQ